MKRRVVIMQPLPPAMPLSDWTSRGHVGKKQERKQRRKGGVTRAPGG